MAVGSQASVGELEHLVLLSILHLGNRGSALGIREVLESEGRRLTRGALYRSLDRLAEKGLLDWDVAEPTPDRGGHARRLYAVTEEGLALIRGRKATLERLWAGAAGLLKT